LSECPLQVAIVGIVRARATREGDRNSRELLARATFGRLEGYRSDARRRFGNLLIAEVGRKRKEKLA
jgi:hypothetical protein